MTGYSALRILIAIALPVTMSACRKADEARAEAMCAKASSVENRNPRAALELKRQIYEQMPTAGTAAAKLCVAPIRERMGNVRILVSEDEKGDVDTIDGCAWVADVMEIFEMSVNPPYRKHWAKRLVENCLTVVGRAWTRTPDDPELRALSERLEKLSR